MTASAPRLIVGIGASAGGLEALKGLLSALPLDTGMSFVVVTHMPRDRDSHLAEILRRHTSLRVEDAADGMAIEPDTLYVAPPDAVVQLKDFRLVLHQRSLHPMHKPIDVFFSALALHSNEEAIAIVLSGGGSDGTLGIKAIKERGGLTMAQGADGAAPQHSSMPDAAIASGLIDLVLPAQEIGPHLAKYAASYPEHLAAVLTAPRTGYEALYTLLHQQVGHDFSGYKQSTFHRRVHRRMHIVRAADLDAYVALLRSDAREVTLLFRELLIGVTNFFRDDDAFEALARDVIPNIVAGKGADDSVRVWVPGCATGEEAYSIAMLIREFLDTVEDRPKVQIFASDIDDVALSAARQGRYPAALMESVSPPRRARFFVDDGVSFVVSKEIREMCVFSPQSVLRDPPFSRIDLVSCRNLLIYLGADFQAQVIPIFHFALRPQGYLFLGVSENISQYTDLFAAVDRKQRIFQKRDHVVTRLNLPRSLPEIDAPAPGLPIARRDSAKVPDTLRRAVERRVLERHAPAHVVVNRDGDIVLYSRRTGRFIEPSDGAPSRQLLTQARRGLRVDLRAALQDAMSTGQRAAREGIVSEVDGRAITVDVSVEPFGDYAKDPLYLVVFRETGEVGHEAASPLSGDERLEQLESELRDTRERLQGEIEEHEAALEELKSSSEELQSVNEELQSSNEELESSKEELQSVNEELLTINAELNSKIEALDQANADLANVLDSTKVATIFLDRNLAIRSFTPAATEIYSLIAADSGRKLTDIACKLQESDLENDMRTVLASDRMVERTVRCADGSASFLMRVLPHRSPAGHFDGILATFVNVSSVPEAELRQRVLIEELNHRVRNMLTVVNSIANQTLRQTATKEDFVAAFTGRIRAMGAAYTVVAERNWSEVSLKTVLQEQIRPFADAEFKRFRLAGPEVRFSPSAALSFSLVIHELVVNAAKYGALSNADGQVTLEWKIEGGQLVMDWRERGGPPVPEPKRRGFGSELVHGEVTSRLAGSFDIAYKPTGLEARIAMPLGADIAEAADDRRAAD